MKKRSLASKQVLKDYLLAIGVAAFVAILIRIFALEAFRIPVDFMSPTLLPGDHIFVNKLAYAPWKKVMKMPARGDVIVFAFPSDPKKEFIKRVMALPGDTIEIRDRVVWLNSKAVSVLDSSKNQLQNTILSREQIGDQRFETQWSVESSEGVRMIPVRVPEGHVFVLGDHRSKGQDSRGWGFVPVRYITGRAWLIWFSFGKLESGNWGMRTDRIFKKVH